MANGLIMGPLAQTKMKTPYWGMMKITLLEIVAESLLQRDLRWQATLLNHWWNLVEALHVNCSQCLEMPARNCVWSINKCGQMAAIFKIWNFPLLNTVTISSSHLLLDHWLDFFKTCLRCSTGGLFVSIRKWFQSNDKYVAILLMNQNYSNRMTNMAVQGS